jgi:hypothetical protein
MGTFSIIKSDKSNLVIYLYSKAACNLFYKKKNNLHTIFRYIYILEDNFYYKIVIYRISTEDFNIEDSLLLIRNKLKIFNNSLRLTINSI